MRMLGRQVCSVQRLFEEFQLSHCHFTVFRYSALHVKDQVLTCGGVGADEFSRCACVHWEKTRQPVIARLVSKAPTLCPQLSSQHSPSTLPHAALVAGTATKHTFSNAYLNQCLANALILNPMSETLQPGGNGKKSPISVAPKLSGHLSVPVLGTKAGNSTACNENVFSFAAQGVVYTF